MQDVLYLDDVEQVRTLVNPLRLEILKQLDRPRTCPELGRLFGETPQKVYYHVKALERAGLVDKVEERRVRGVVEGYYQARARSYWIAPHLVGQIGGRRAAQDQASLRYLLSLAEQVADDVGRLGQRSEAGQDVPSLALSAQIHLPDGNQRAGFLKEVHQAFRRLARKYGAPADDGPDAGEEQSFRLVLACYPHAASPDEPGSG
jgi:DNA-binding transcriptional ArsR family regulator